jgi:hypothetical protein
MRQIKGRGTGRPGRRRSLLVVQLFFRSFRMRVARLLLCCVLLEDYSTNLGGTAITSDAMRQDGPSSATNPTLSGTHSRTYSSAYCRLLPFFAPWRRRSREREFLCLARNGTKNARTRTRGCLGSAEKLRDASDEGLFRRTTLSSVFRTRPWISLGFGSNHSPHRRRLR